MKVFHNFPLIFFFDPLCVRVCCPISTYLWFSSFLFVFNFNFYSIVVRKGMLKMYLLSLFLWSNIWSVLESFHVYLRKIWVLLLWGLVLHFLIDSVSSYFLPYWKLGIEVSNYFYYRSIHFLSILSNFYSYILELLLGVYIFIIVIFSW